MKKLVSFMLVFTLLLSMFTISVSAQENIKVYINNQLVEFDVQPRTINGRTMVPLRAIFEKLGAKVEWDGATKTVTAHNENTKVSATIGKFDMIINDEIKPIDVAPCEIDGRTLVPARFVAEAFNCDVKWEDKLKAVFIISNVENVKEENDSSLQTYKENENVIDFGIFANIEANKKTKEKKNFRIYSKHTRLVDVYCKKYAGTISIDVINEYIDMMEKNDYIKTIEEVKWGNKDNTLNTVLWDGKNAVSVSYIKDKSAGEYKNVVIEFCVIKDYYSIKELKKIMIQDRKTADEEKERIEREIEAQNEAKKAEEKRKAEIIANRPAYVEIKIHELKKEKENKEKELILLRGRVASDQEYWSEIKKISSEIMELSDEIFWYENMKF